MEALQSVYLAVTIIGAGAIILDVFGLIGHHSSSDSGCDSGFEHGGHHLAHNIEDQKTEALPVGHSDSTDNVLAIQKPKERNGVILFFSILRNMIYFFIGFGPAGLISYQKGAGLQSLLLATLLGAVAVFGVKLFRRVMRRELDSQRNEEDFLLEKGEVLVTIPPGQMGKVRIYMEGSFYDRYAKGQDPQKRYPAGHKIKVIEVDENFLLIEDELRD